ncbi:M56 family metallopeptidase [Chryseobacterium pennipullorum]|uniref:Peptidase M56 domain-containing protein n=1 Tax=Chryseobacterium pennipullorum TaxID=2258963 RepID=A0A3D9AQX6_9FLAO|nr:M56 family metallopeptidase [Chryseobacterium pennipullorum]REC43799.1 hypothetical protein DRF67_18865 [Chryseobacterium pennipullorum]
MEAVILKIILCSSVFIAVYYMFLEKERMYRFNRLYLLSSLVLSNVIPFITVTLPAFGAEKKPGLVIDEIVQVVSVRSQHESSFSWVHIVWIIYISVTVLLLIKSLAAFIKVKRIKGEQWIYQNYRIILTAESFSPFSFWNTMYMGKNYVQNNAIDPRIFLHEKSHLDQKHSVDLILVDMLKIFTWFNPVIFLYKKAMITNHEFLADEAVLQNHFNMKDYQNLILEEIITSQNQHLTHSFNFNNTKKRFIMMKAKKTKFSNVRKTAGITALIAATFLFSEKIYATHPSVSEEITSTRSNQHLDKEDGNNLLSNKTDPALSKRDDKNAVFQQEKPETIREVRENVKAIPDTISPKKPAETLSNEGKNTSITMNSESDKGLIQPQYPDGMKVLRSKIGNTMDISILTPKKGSITSTAYIHIDAKGKATDITTSGDDDAMNRELLRTITAISNETTWKPATQNGQAIASVLKVPATLTFAN